MFDPARFLKKLNRCAIMGIVNITGDSFSEGASSAPESAVRRAFALAEEGADILDLGAESTRPGSSPVSPEEECDRLLPVFRELKNSLPQMIFSIDTRHGETAEELLKQGAHMINDVSMGREPKLLAAAAFYKAGLILCHSRGTPQTMNSPQYTSYPGGVRREVEEELEKAFRRAAAAGVAEDHIWLDPGIGFAKTAEQCRTLIAEAKEFSCHRSWLWGISRKSFMGGEVGSRKEETCRLEKQLIDSGVSVIRTHDVAALRLAAAWDMRGI